MTFVCDKIYDSGGRHLLSIIVLCSYIISIHTHHFYQNLQLHCIRLLSSRCFYLILELHCSTVWIMNRKWTIDHRKVRCTTKYHLTGVCVCLPVAAKQTPKTYKLWRDFVLELSIIYIWYDTYTNISNIFTLFLFPTNKFLSIASHIYNYYYICVACINIYFKSLYNSKYRYACIVYQFCKILSWSHSFGSNLIKNILSLIPFLPVLYFTKCWSNRHIKTFCGSIMIYFSIAREDSSVHRVTA